MLHGAADAARVRIVSVDRPGFGKSIGKPLTNASIVEVANAIIATMNDVGCARYTVVAVSGGCPYALAVAALAPQAVEKVVIISGLGELTPRNALEGMIAQNRLMLRIAKVAPLLCKPAVRVIAEGWRSHPHGMIRYMAKMLPGEDRAILLDRSFSDPFAISMQRGVQHGHSGPYQELRRISKPWGFSLKGITCPVEIFHGDADRYVPISHAQWVVSQIAHARLHVKKDRGHFMAARMGKEILEAARRAEQR